MEMIKYICPIFLFICSVLAFFFGIRILCTEERKYTENKLLSVFCFSSGIWSVGFGFLIIQTDVEIAYRCRVFGMIGTILYLIMAQMLACYLSNLPKRWTTFFNGFACTGIIIYFLTVEKSQTIFQLHTSGMTYYFKPGVSNNLYTIYSLALAVFIFAISIHMVFSKTKRLKHFGKIFMLTVVIMLLGTVLDTVFPLMGIPAIPGSTITQFWGFVVIYIAIRANNRSKINITNMSEFIYLSLSMPVLVYDSQHHLQIANDAAAHFLDIDRELIPHDNMSIDTLFLMDDTSVFDFEGTSCSVDTCCIRNQLYCNLAISKIQDRYNDIIGYIIIVTDLSERMKNMQQLEEAKQEAESANRSKTAFLANMSHEIRTPMNAIMGFSELILKMDIPDTARDCALDIKNSCQNLLAIINDILDISKLDSGKMKLACDNYYTNTLLQDVYHIIDVQARKKGLNFFMNIDPGIPHELYGDITRIRGILINILNNSVKYTKAGNIIFSVRLLRMQENTATLEFSVSDTGIGIKKNAMEHLFDSFARLDHEKSNDIEGTGLGLSIVKGYVDLMGGTINVESIYGLGSTFTVILDQVIVNDSPMEQLPEDLSQGNSLNMNEIRIRDTKVLVTDDNQINLKVIKNTLEYYGLAVDTATNGEDAVRMSTLTDYPLIFMDQMMPGMDGIEAMQRIRGISSHYAYGGPGKIVVLTANAISGVRKELMEAGFDEYLSKPIEFQELERVLSLFISPDKFTKKEVVPSSQADTIPLEKILPEVDIAAGIENCGDDKDLYLEILLLLRDSATEQLGTLIEYYAEADHRNFALQMRNLRSQLLNIGYTTLSTVALEIETATKEGNHEYVVAHLEAFCAKYHTLVTQLDVLYRMMQ